MKLTQEQKDEAMTTIRWTIHDLKHLLASINENVSWNDTDFCEIDLRQAKNGILKLEKQLIGE